MVISNLHIFLTLLLQKVESNSPNSECGLDWHVASKEQNIAEVPVTVCKV